MARVRFRGKGSTNTVAISVTANVTSNSSPNAPDEYDLSFWEQRRSSSTREHQLLFRHEEFKFKRTQGRGRRITVEGNRAEFMDSGPRRRANEKIPLRRDSLALSTLRRLPPDEGGEEIERVATLFTSFRVFDVDVGMARLPGRISDEPLNWDAGNLATSLMRLAEDEDIYRDFLDDVRAMVPGIEAIEFAEVPGASSAPSLAVTLVERGLRDATYLADASFGTVRILALLALLYDPNPPLLTCIEEVDHGLHPYLFDRLVERLREASSRTQLLIATHSPALVNRLVPDELLVVERAEDGSTRLPAISRADIRLKRDAVGGRMDLGEMWFSGSLGGVPR